MFLMINIFLCVSLTLFGTYSSVRKLVKLSAVQFMLNNHTVSEQLELFSLLNLTL